jgi:AraC family transcriptional regulator
MNPRIVTSKEKKLIGKRMIMSLVDNKTSELWKSFVPRRREIANNLTDDLISMQVYKPSHFADFKPTNEFEKWATVEVTDFGNVPNDMETFIVPAGLYAIFDYKGLSSDPAIFQYLFGTWLPNSGYDLANRPHFEILGGKYKNNDPTSEEQIWIPIAPTPTLSAI